MVILAILIIVRVFFLLTTERTLDMDECVVGVMTQRIARQGEVFVHPIGEDYGGGNAFIAYVAAMFSKVFGLSDITIKSVTVMFSVLVIWVYIHLVGAMIGFRAGLVSGLLLSFLPPYLKASLKVDGYIVNFRRNSTVIKRHEQGRRSGC
ncbi:MAG: hypothetical protein AB1742_05295 [bacterium]